MEPMSESPSCTPVNSTSIDRGVEVSLQEWLDSLQLLQVTRVDMNRLVMNYLVTEGFKEAAEKFRMESGVEVNIELNELDERIRIREAIQDGRIQDAISLINQIHPELLDTNNHLYFHLLQQHTIELIRDRNIGEALDFAQTHIAEKGTENTELLPEIECTLALLAFDKPESSPYGNLLNTAQRHKVAAEVNSALLSAVECRNTTSNLSSLLKLLLWAQHQLDNKNIRYPAMTDFVSGTLKEPK